VIVMTRPRRGLKSWKEGIMNRDGNLGILYCYIVEHDLHGLSVHKSPRRRNFKWKMACNMTNVPVWFFYTHGFSIHLNTYSVCLWTAKKY
jgi:hypothetical protein